MGAVPRIPAGYPTARIPSLLKRVKDGVAALKAVGESVAAVKISPEGEITVLTGAPAAIVNPAQDGANEWDEVLPRR